MLYAAKFLLVSWNGFILSIMYEHLRDKTELLIFALQGLTVLHSSIANAQMFLKIWRERNCAAHVYKQMKVNIPTL